MPTDDEQRAINNLADEIFLHIITRVQNNDRFSAIAIRRQRGELECDMAREAAERAADVAIQARRIMAARIASAGESGPAIPAGAPKVPPPDMDVPDADGRIRFWTP